MELPIDDILKSLGDLDGWCFLTVIALWLVSREYKRLINRWIDRQNSQSDRDPPNRNKKQ